ncbi:MAG: DEAD/DEAH box helicase [Desulfurococcaceae archaeon]
MLRVNSENLLSSKGYSYIKIVEPASEPRYSHFKFKDIIEEFSTIEIGESYLYQHQHEAFKALSSGSNIVLRAGTGSGKTEAWVLYLLSELKKSNKIYTIAVYPTLALANDQVKRLEKYLGLLNKSLIQLDSVKKEELVKKTGLSALRTLIATSNLIITNPAFLLHDLKKYFINKPSALLAPLYSRLKLLVIDELDFYTPRSLALLLATISLLSKTTEEKLQVAILSAGIANPLDLCKFLEDTTSRECKVIEGEPFKVENSTYIILGKNLENIWREISEQWSNIVKKHPDLKSFSQAIFNIEEFKKNAYKILSILESLGYSVPSIAVDPMEIISEYFRDKYVTIVFTRSINTAEEVAKSIKQKYGENTPVATHHHLVSKKTREEVEEKARRGDIKVIISPRTLSQGMDIGLVARIIHLGLPDNVREFHQREGRKGRRRELLFSETIIIPYSRWDKELLSSGLEVFKEWLGLGLERTIVNPDNLYIHLFTGVVKLISPWFKQDLTPPETEAVRKAGILGEDNKVDLIKLREVYEKINFYEYAPPYGIKRYLERDGKLIPLEPIGHVDLVEKFQPGCIDYGEEAMVISLEYGKSTRFVRAVIEKLIREIDFKTNDALSIALEEYRYIKLRWNETPSIIKDLLSGKITSEELCVVYTPRNGFGKYIKIPERCIWTLRSDKPRFILVNGEPIVYYDKKTIYVPTPTGGEYRDFTYGYVYSIDPRENIELIRLALSYVIILLRRYLNLPLHTILYDVVKLGEYKYFALHEPESAGILDKMNWLQVRRFIESHRPGDLDRIIISEIDDLAYSTLITIEFNWDLVRETALRVVDYILARDRIKAFIKGKEILIPRPSPGLKILSYVVISETLDEESLTPSLLTAHGFYDGEKFHGQVELYPPLPLVKPPARLLEVENQLLDKVFYEDYKLIVENWDTTISQVKQANLRRLVSYLESRKRDIYDVSSLIERSRLKSASADEIALTMETPETVNYASILNVFRKIREHRKVLERERDLILKYLEEKARKLYIAYLVLAELSKIQ